MSATFQPALPAIAFQLAAALEDYEAEFERMAGGEIDLEQAARLGQKLDVVRTYRGAFPNLAADMVELLLCHSELMHDEWRVVRLDPEERKVLLDRHNRAIRAMRTKCMKLFSPA
jgi:hypothetical protein